METKKTTLNGLKLNDSNPRIIRDAKFEKLLKSILTLPKMLTLRPVVANSAMVVLGGNMRMRALQEIAKMTEQELTQKLKAYGREDLIDLWLRWHDKPEVEYVSAEELTDEEQQQFIIKDNVGYGEWDWDMLANEWDTEELSDWGVDVWVAPSVDIDDLFKDTDIADKKKVNDIIKVEIPATQKDSIEAIKNAIEEACKEWKGCKVIL